MNAHDPVIVSAVRTPIGSFGGAFKNQTHTNLASIVMDEVCKRADFPKDRIDDIFWGIVMQRCDENGLARGAALKAGIPEETSAAQINRACCSGMDAIRIGSLAIRLGDADAILAGGGECMSGVPFVVKNARWGLRLRHQELSDGLWDSLTDHHTGLIMGMTAENVAAKYGISREDQDEFAYTSQLRAKTAVTGGRFKDEIVPVVIPGKRGKADTVVDTDEYPRFDTAMDNLALLKPTFKKDGTVTAGNASGINDGASAVLILSHETANQLNFSRQWKIVGSVAVGVDPSIMGIGPIPAIRKLLGKTGYTLDDIELFEINEAFAAASLAVEQELGLSRDIVNVNGGGIALGHPVGNSGCRVVVSLIHELEKRGLNRGLAALCGGGGHGQAMIIERV
ncbi:acetyl-CoA acetyltransferase [Desulfosarcina ovata subsp. sediminis]|uniref:Acetyl-CoA acetyltransferase n=1 Tax=Desulfosarcina ovata subsp. sediminis TaxID=885957 RepID=A0A5K7ZRC7_9BACT|nr:acetyl-CoA C-acyltransferase [Desulfosarcina ovata]BBO81163.1 acetyl-CoA acetyltransferase [Desulfosarcina ovata subsp. sediminis]